VASWCAGQGWFILIRAVTRVSRPRKTNDAAGLRRELPARERNKLDKRQRIRDAAYALFCERGFEQTTVAQIAARAGVAKGTVFLYASDKDDLLCLIMNDRLRAVVDAQFATLPRRAPLLEQLMHVFGGLFAMYAEHPTLALSFIRVFPTAMGPNGQAQRGLTMSFMHQLAGLVRAASERGEIAADVPPMQAAQNLFALYFLALLGGVSGHVPSLAHALDPGLKDALALQLRGLRPMGRGRRR
jgi:AcrR family transcriptional regulator